MMTAQQVQALKPTERPYKRGLGNGLYVIVQPNGQKWWRYKYLAHGREQTLSLGTARKVTLKEAREKALELRHMRSNSIDPSQNRRATRQIARERDTNGFEVVAREWFETKKEGWVPGHRDKVIRRIERHLLPALATLPINSIDGAKLLAVIRAIENTDKIETARRALSLADRIFQYALTTGRGKQNPAKELPGALKARVARHFPTITDENRIRALLLAIDGYEGNEVTRVALRLLPHLFVRSSELRYARWSELQLEGEHSEWHIPAERMKGKVKHIVPLSTQASNMLLELRQLSGDEALVFPGLRSRQRPISNNTINAALRRLGYDKTEMVAHGFRAMASTLLHEKGWPSDAVERQLAHNERNHIKGIYNYALHLPLRRQMMQWWSDSLEGLKIGKPISLYRGSI